MALECLAGNAKADPGMMKKFDFGKIFKIRKIKKFLDFLVTLKFGETSTLKFFITIFLIESHFPKRLSSSCFYTNNRKIKSIKTRQ